MADFEIEDHSSECIEELRQKVPRILTEIGLAIEGEAKDALEMPPRRIDTGLLRNSITYALSGEAAAQSTYHADSGGGSGSYTGSAPADDEQHMAVYIGTNVEYAAYVHEGTRHMSPNRFLKNAVEMNKDQIERTIKDGLEEA